MAPERGRVRVAARVAVAAPPPAVFGAVTDWDGQSGWMVLTRVAAAGGPAGVGERLLAVTGVGPLGFRDPMQVTRLEPPSRVEVRHLGRVVRGSGTFLVDPAPGGAWLTWVEDLELPLGALGRAGFALVRPVVGGLLRRSLRRLARQLETARRAR